MVDYDHIAGIEKKVHLLLAENKYSVNKLCEQIGMTPNGYSKMWKNRSIKVETIQKIADVFEIPISHFFTTRSENPYSIEAQSNEVSEIREKYIQALESENQLLKKLLQKEK